MQNSELLESFIQEAGEVMTGLEAGVTRLSSTPGQPLAARDMEQLSVLAHRMKGTAGLYGYQQLSTLSGLLERLLDARPNLQGEQQARFLTLLGTINGVLRGGLASLQGGGSDRDLGLIFTQEGGTALLQGLVQEVPGEFQMRNARHLTQHQPELDEETPAIEEAPQGLEGELRQFVKENGEVWEYFAPEVQEHLGNLRNEFEKGEQADLNVMFRAAHTIKGSSFMVGLQPLGNFAHRMEDLLGALREDAVPNNAEVQRTLHASVDLMDDLTRVAEGADLNVQARHDDLLGSLRALATGQVAVPAAAPAQATETAATVTAPVSNSIRVPAQRLEDLLEQVSEVVTARARMTRLMERLDDLQGGMQASQQRFQRTVRDFEERYLNPDMVRVQDDSAASMGSGNLMEQFAELEFDSYNDLNILSRSITELSADFAEVRRNLSDTVAELNEENEKLGKLVRQLRVDVSQTSRVPFTQASARLRRWARQQSVPFDLNVEGEDVQLESNLLQRIVDPLLHLLTNAVYHGLEGGQPQVSRQTHGKPERGQVWLRAETKDNFIDITVADDGQGLNLARIRERALERGLRSAQELDQMPDSDLSRLILLPGLSTAEAVGNVTGRGVGMDVVATAVRALGGELLIQTEQNVGTAFTLRLPITQRILDILKVDLGEENMAAFPVANVRAIRDIPDAQIEVLQGTPYVTFLGEQVPVVDARVMWGVDITDALHQETSSRLVFLSTITGLVAVRVAEFGSIEEVSVTPPTGMLAKLEYLAGTTVSITGEALPLLEPVGLSRLARRPDLWLESSDTTESRTNRRVLLVDDSLSVRRLVGRMLERGGLIVETANDGQEALDKLQLDDNFDAVITDLEMPRMNGYELISALRARAQNANTPILVMTTRAGDKHQRLAFQLGANDYFTKPVNEALLLRRLSTLLSGPQVKGTQDSGAQVVA